MSEIIKHECGIALLRLLKPLEFYIQKYDTPLWGLNKLLLLMEKQLNRGQDGAGLAILKWDELKPASIFHKRSNNRNPLHDLFQTINHKIKSIEAFDIPNSSLCGNVFLGHLRYNTFGQDKLENCHPMIRQSNHDKQTLVMAGNFNLTNVKSLTDKLAQNKGHYAYSSDTAAMLELLGQALDKQYSNALENSAQSSIKTNANSVDLIKAFEQGCSNWDGGFCCSGFLKEGQAFAFRDPSAIRPAFFYKNDEIIAVASERSPLQKAFSAPLNKINEIPPANALIIKKNGSFSLVPYTKKRPKRSCLFERIYLSAASDQAIYSERKKLGKLLLPSILKAVNGDLVNTIFTFIPNTAEPCFFGLSKALEEYCDKIKLKKILAHSSAKGCTANKMADFINMHPRVEKILSKDTKLRTFIMREDLREQLVENIYDIASDVVRPKKDTLIVIDDSIVRGTTMRESIIKTLVKTEAQKVIIASSAPQIRYPDCYGIDLASLEQLVAFQAAIKLLKENNLESIVASTYDAAKQQLQKPAKEMKNVVKNIYAPFSDHELSNKIGELLCPTGIRQKIMTVFQPIENLYTACPDHSGDWYFTGNYPTPGGNRVVNQAFVNYIEGIAQRAY